MFSKVPVVNSPIGPVTCPRYRLSDRFPVWYWSSWMNLGSNQKVTIYPLCHHFHRHWYAPLVWHIIAHSIHIWIKELVEVFIFIFLSPRSHRTPLTLRVLASMGDASALVPTGTMCVLHPKKAVVSAIGSYHLVCQESKNNDSSFYCFVSV